MDPALLISLIEREQARRAAVPSMPIGDTTAQPTVTPGSEIERCLKQNAASYKDKGDRAYNDSQYAAAVNLYSVALKAAVRVHLNGDQIALILSARSRTFCALKEFSASLDDAERCVFARPGWYKGAELKMHAFIGIGDFQEAFYAGAAATACFDEMSEDKMLEIFAEVMILLPKVPDYSDIVGVQVLPHGWRMIFQILTKRKAWQSISIILQGRGTTPPILTSYKATYLDLSGLLVSSSVTDWKSWGQRLSIKLLESGAKMGSLDPDQKHAAHSALRMAIKTGVYDLLKYLFLHYIPTADRDRVDDAGDTLLHLACREMYPSKLTAVKLLLEHNLSCLCRNKQQKKPLDLLPDDDPDRGAIVEALRLKDNAPDQTHTTHADVSGLNSTDDHAKHTQTNSSSRSSCIETKYWNKEQVEDWLRENKLPHDVMQRFAGMEGRQLAELRTVQETAPATFYQLLHHTLGLSLVQLLTLASAIRKLKCSSSMDCVTDML